MKIGIMQPYFMPYIGYWQLISAVDRFVLLDDVNYIKRGWINRNRILIGGQASLFSLPVARASQNKRIMDTKLAFSEKEKNKFLKTISMAYKKAPYFPETFSLLQEIVCYEEDDLTGYISHSIRQVMSYLKIDTIVLKSSKIRKNDALHAQDRILEICKILGAADYYNAVGGMALYDFATFKEHHIKLGFIRTDDDICYQQFGSHFVKNLSVIDVMMFQSVGEIRKMLRRYEVL